MEEGRVCTWRRMRVDGEVRYFYCHPHPPPTTFYVEQLPSLGQPSRSHHRNSSRFANGSKAFSCFSRQIHLTPFLSVKQTACHLIAGLYDYLMDSVLLKQNIINRWLKNCPCGSVMENNCYLKPELKVEIYWIYIFNKNILNVYSIDTDNLQYNQCSLSNIKWLLYFTLALMMSSMTWAKSLKLSRHPFLRL